MRYLNKVSVSPRYSLLVAHHKRASDPSKGEAGNPQTIRSGFTCQNVTSQDGQSRLGIFQDKKVKLIIQVNSLDYFNDRLGNAPPFYSKDEILAYVNKANTLDELPSLKAGDDFGQASGDGGGNVVVVASELASALNAHKLGISASVDPNDNTQVLVKTESIDDDLYLKLVSYSYKILNGVPPFIIKDADGNVIYNPDDDDRGVKVIVKRNEDISPISEF
tara:strand:+ start:112 stop:771 length:660 start_codon:yes stop_codon:yes gene_type:complete